jgi:hypothetical protein
MITSNLKTAKQGWAKVINIKDNIEFTNGGFCASDCKCFG